VSSCGWLGAMGPGEVFVVGAMVAQAAVEDADQAVGQRAEGLVVGGAAAAFLGGPAARAAEGGDLMRLSRWKSPALLGRPPMRMLATPVSASHHAIRS
jgi:hypothetical protein